MLDKKQSLAGLFCLALLTGCSSGSSLNDAAAPSVQEETSMNDDVAESERLGTEWGDDVRSTVQMVDLRRVSSEPSGQMQINYAAKSYSGRAINSKSLLAGKIDFSVADDRGVLPIYRDNRQYYLQGQNGQAYRLIYHNNSADTYEIVASVDGLNVMNGSAASRYDSGYVLNPYSDLVIEGFRKSNNSVASFIFSQPDDAYAANTSQGSINNTGVIGTVIYELYDPSKSQPRQPQAYPADNGYATPPQ